MLTDAPFTPWRDDSFLEQESLYALWNKVSWFAAVRPVALLRACRSAGKVASASPKVIDYASPQKWVRYTENCAALPLVHGHKVDDLVRRIDTVTREEVAAAWAAPSLRICDTCIADGIHLRIHQHLAVSYCPLHSKLLRDTCSSCGAALRYCSEKNKAFRCAACGNSLLAGDMIRFALSLEDRRVFAKIHEEACRWLRYLESGIYREHLGYQVIGPSDDWMPYLDVRSLLLEALARAFPQRPSWLARPAAPVGGVSLASVRARTSVVPKSFALGAAVSESIANRLDPPASAGSVASGPRMEREDRLLIAHYQQALQRVANQFHRVIADAHQTCLNVPLLIESGDREDGTFDFAIFSCCPVALGYWLWRKRSGAFFIELVNYGLPGFRRHGLLGVEWKDDLLLYSAERSHLHACLRAANEMTSAWRSARKGAAGLCLDMLAYWRTSRVRTSSAKSDQHYFDLSSRELTFVRVDATTLLKQAGCPGLEPYYRYLRRKLRSVVTYNPRTIQMEAMSMEDQWQARASEQVERLQPMECDWIFYGALVKPQRRFWTHEARHAKACVVDMKISPFEVVQRAVNGRPPAST